MYPSRVTSSLWRDNALLGLAQRMARSVGNWEFWATYLFHHANALIKYKLLADRENKGRTTDFSVTELRKQLLLCLAPFLEDIDAQMRQEKIKRDNSPLFMPQDKLALFASTMDVNRYIPLVIYSTNPDLGYPTLEPRRRVPNELMNW
ncbi:hypothetical protein NMY22_g10378 [Coprinellus aureogranulatus]|nr:hypothetical protein NMY22_g10378 [Coprinellus aureogranulatus]